MIGFVWLGVSDGIRKSLAWIPQAGIYTAIVGGFVVSLLGGHALKIGGLTERSRAASPRTVLRPAHGHDDGGHHPVVLAVTGFGQTIKFILRPVVLGFTNGTAC